MEPEKIIASIIGYAGAMMLALAAGLALAEVGWQYHQVTTLYVNGLLFIVISPAVLAIWPRR